MDLLTVGTVDGRPALLTRGDRHRTVRIWDLTTREELHGRLTSEYTSPSIEFFAAVDDRFGVTEEGRVWDLTASQWIGVQPQRRGALALETLEDRSVILTSHRTEEVHLWDLAAGELLAPPLMGHTSGVCAGGRPARWTVALSSSPAATERCGRGTQAQGGRSVRTPFPHASGD
ncbi:hypothetical protein ACKI1J_42625 [Streptomyces scabiei]|uniref:hypothetical protein n=1 Tax=Streptomyces scabiei TaxID=1930 RepID=UPI0038F8EE23